MPEQATFRNVAHEKFYDDEQLVYSLIKSWCELRCWCAADRLLQIGVRRSVVELHSLDAAKIVVIAGILRVGSRSREIRFRDELVGLVVKAVMEVIAEKAIDEGSLGLIVMTKRSSSLGSKEEARRKRSSE